jgi:hypothetical protein
MRKITTGRGPPTAQKLSSVVGARISSALHGKCGPPSRGEMMRKGNKEQIGRVVRAFPPMKKFIIADLERAYRGL